MKCNKIKEARIRNGYSQKDLADCAGVTRQTVNLIEAGKYNPSLKICKNICKALDKSLDEIFGD